MGNRPTGVLLVEDEGSLLELETNILNMKGYRAFQAKNGKAALATLTKEATLIDLAMIDITLPDMKGTEVAERIRVLLPKLPIILTSGSDPHELDTLSTIVPGGAFCLLKPFSISMFLKIIRDSSPAPSAGRP